MKKFLSVLLKILAGLIVVGVVVYFNRGTVLTTVVDAVGLSDPFVGVTSDGTVQTGLFSIERTGVSTAPVVRAAQNFLETLDEDQLGRTQYPVDDTEWRQWMNIHLYDRQGVGLLEMNEAQMESAYGLLQAAMGDRGYAQARDIMRLDTTLGELKGDDFEWYGEKRFWYTVMGGPSATSPWGWQLDGHHLVINYFALGDQVVMSPIFLGAEPVIAPSGKHQGVAVLQQEQDLGLAMMQALSAEQRAKASVSAVKDGNNAYGEFYSDNAVVPIEGLPVAELDDDQLRQFLELVGLYLGNMDDGHARVKMFEVVEHLDDTYFSWVGEVEADAVFYYRIQSPVIMIEFDHQRPVGLSHLASDNSPQRQHIHVVIRTPNGNDYGKDLLRRHLATDGV